jgi:hypothetical protein
MYAIALAFTLGLVSSPANAALVGFVNNPTSNSVDWTNAVNGMGMTVNTNVNFDAMPVGTLVNNFYQASDGVTLTPSDTSINQVVNGVGPGQWNNLSPPVSPGEGQHAASNYLSSESPGQSSSSLVISFTTAVSAVGLSTIDYFAPVGFNNLLRIEAYTGQDATGTLLGSFDSARFNFQINNVYFMGLLSTTDDIGSVRFLRNPESTGDIIGIDDIRFARQQAPAVPEPSSMALLGLGAAGLVGIARSARRRRA